MHVLITGATGFIGRTLVPILCQQADISVTLLLRERYSDPSQLPREIAAIRSRVETCYADLRHFGLTARAIRESEPDSVIHLAAAGATDPFLSIDTSIRHNVQGTVHLLRACFEKTGTVRQVITARTPGERSMMNVYAASKAAAWNFCQMYSRTQGWPVHGAMVFQAYGPGQSDKALVPAAMRAALAGHDFPMTAGTQERDWIYVTDVAAGLCAMLHADLPAGDTIELGTGRLTSVADVVGMIYRLAQASGLVARPGTPLIGALPRRPGEEQCQEANAAYARQMLRWHTAVSLEDGLNHFLAYLHNRS